MTQSIRKLIGTLIFVFVLLVAYPLLAAEIYATWLSTAPWGIAIGYALVVGLLWALPAMVVIRWMSRP